MVTVGGQQQHGACWWLVAWIESKQVLAVLWLPRCGTCHAAVFAFSCDCYQGFLGKGLKRTRHAHDGRMCHGRALLGGCGVLPMVCAVVLLGIAFSCRAIFVNVGMLDRVALVKPSLLTRVCVCA